MVLINSANHQLYKKSYYIVICCSGISNIIESVMYIIQYVFSDDGLMALEMQA